jgi:hypothetical protein
VHSTPTWLHYGRRHEKVRRRVQDLWKSEARVVAVAPRAWATIRPPAAHEGPAGVREATARPRFEQQLTNGPALAARSTRREHERRGARAARTHDGGGGEAMLLAGEHSGEFEIGPRHLLGRKSNGGLYFLLGRKTGRLAIFTMACSRRQFIANSFLNF